MRAKKGRLLVGQSGGCTTVMNASLIGVVQEALHHTEIEAVYGALHGIEGLLNEELVDLSSEDPSTLELVRHTPAAALGSGRYRLQPGDVERALEVLQAHEIRYFTFIGGNDSADTSHRLARAAAAAGYEMRVIAVPKTIDNDLPLTDHSPGYGSIARFIAMSVRDGGRDTEAMKRREPVKIVEVMGRNAGWVAAASALGKRDELDAPHLIYVPERPLSLDRFLDEVETAYRRFGIAVAVVTETIREHDGKPIGQPPPPGAGERADPFGHLRLAGAAAYLCQQVISNLGLLARWDKPGTIQRMSMACASPVDLAEAYLVGQAAVRYAVAGESDAMVALVREAGAEYGCTTGLAPLAAVANTEKRLPEEYLQADWPFVTPAFLDYARPLIGGPLPEYSRLRGLRVPPRRQHPLSSEWFLCIIQPNSLAYAKEACLDVAAGLVLVSLRACCMAFVSAPPLNGFSGHCVRGSDHGVCRGQHVCGEGGRYRLWHRGRDRDGGR